MSWHFDKAHSSIEFTAEHMRVSSVEGVFKDFDAEIVMDPEHPERSRVRAVIQTASLDTGNEARDADLRSEEFLDAEHHPTIVFVSERAARIGEHGVWINGALTIRGVTHQVRLEGDFVGPTIGPSGRRTVDIMLAAGVGRRAFLPQAGLLDFAIGEIIVILLRVRLEEDAESPDTQVAPAP